MRRGDKGAYHEVPPPMNGYYEDGEASHARRSSRPCRSRHRPMMITQDLAPVTIPAPAPAPVPAPAVSPDGTRIILLTRQGQRRCDENAPPYPKLTGTSGPVSFQRNFNKPNGARCRNIISTARIFPEHWSEAAVQEGLKEGTVFRCTLRANMYSRNEAYATVEGVSVDILVEGACAQNRAVERDVVALLVDQPAVWPKIKGRHVNGKLEADGKAIDNSNNIERVPEDGASAPLVTASTPLEQLEASVQAMSGRRPTGKVVAILEKSDRRRALVGFLGTGLEPVAAEVLHFAPIDPRFPKMLVYVNELPQDVACRLRERDTSVGNELVAAYIKDWDSGSALPHAVVTRYIGQADQVESHTAAVLLEHAVHDAEFPAEVLACLPSLPWNIPLDELTKRRDLRSARIFTMDPATARDLDDALSVERLDSGLVRVGVHIADVSYFVQTGSELDREAQRRSTSVYMIQQVLPMLPRLLCEELCSLNPGVDRLAFTVFWDFDKSGSIVQQWVGRSVIRSCCKLSYENAQDIIDGVFDSSNHSSPKLLDGFSWDELSEDIKILQEISKKLRVGRFDNGALRLDTSKLKIILDGEGNPCDSTIYSRQESSMLVEEFMLLANMTVAKIISAAFPESALLRRHPEPNSKKLKEFEEFCAKHGFDFDTSSAAAMHTSLEKLKERLKDDPVLMSVLILYATKPMQVAEYFCTGNSDDWSHYALGTPVYTHFTSPIRRYPDIIVHRLLSAALEEDELTSELPDAAEISEVAVYSNQRKMTSKSVQEATDRVYLWSMLRQKQGLLSDACVVGLGPKFMCIYICKIAMERRIYYDDVDALKVEWLENTGTLILDIPAKTSKRSRSSKSVSEVALLLSSLDLEDGEKGGSSSSSSNGGEKIQPQHLPLTVRLFSRIPVLVHAVGGDSRPLDIGAKLYVTSYLTA